MKEKALIKKLLVKLPVVAGYIRQQDAFKRCRKELKTRRKELMTLREEFEHCRKEIETLRIEIDHLIAAKANQDFADFTDFCRRHGITMED